MTQPQRDQFLVFGTLTALALVDVAIWIGAIWAAVQVFG